MKKTLYSILTLLTFVTLLFLPDSFAQVGSPEYVVRVVYFLPNDRAPQPDINENLDKLIKDTQLFFADQMTAHGFGRKTFRLEADNTGRLVVHRVNGQFNDAYYQSDTWGKVWSEIDAAFDLSNNIWLTALDVSTELIDNAWCGQGGGSSLGGLALMPASGGCFSISVAAHELGHAFGLNHDNRINGRWVESPYIWTQVDRMIASFCSAEWLDVHRYFEINHTLFNDQPVAVETLDPILISSSPPVLSDMTHLCGVGALKDREYFKLNENVPGDAPPTFEILGPPSLVGAPNVIQLRFRVVDGDGLHQVQLHTPEWHPYVAGGFIACQHVNRTNAAVEFVTTELSSKNEAVWLVIIDKQGNFGWSEFYPINLKTVLPPTTAVSIPDQQLAAAIREQIGNITTRSLLNLRVLEGSNHRGITNLKGLEYAYNLKYVRNVTQGGIVDVSPLRNLVGLTTLMLGEHQIRDINPLANRTHLTELYLWGNNISDISPVASMTNLKQLNLDSNNVSDISAVTGLTNLIYLWVGGNNISGIPPLARLTNLTDLYLWGNNISDISGVAGLTNLKQLHLWENNISDVSGVASLTKLRYLSLGGNNISDISALVNLTNLTHLHVPGNNISDIETLERFMAQGTVVYFSGNPAFETPGPKIENEWIWLIVPATDVNSGSAAARSGRDFLAEASNGTVTEANVAHNGARAGTQVGNYVWTSAPLDATDGDNLNAIVRDYNLGTNTDYPVAYGVVPIQSETQQKTRVYIGGGPVKVWFNRKLIYRDNDTRWAYNYETAVPVTLNAGDNLLFIAAYRPSPSSHWRAYFGFQDGTRYTLGAPGDGVMNLDVNGDGQVTVIDLAIVALFYGTKVPAGSSHRADVNSDRTVDLDDLVAVAQGIDTDGSDALTLDALEAALAEAVEIEVIAEAPMLGGTRPDNFRAILSNGNLAYRNVADALADAGHLGHSVSAVLTRLLQLLKEMTETPPETALLPNYPNPFNPETWIPYHLANASGVQITIFDTRGTVVRQLDLGHQKEGYYMSKVRAAYWDGRNDEGEKVSSGVYFYTLSTESTRDSVTAGEFTATRKLLIIK